MKPSGKLLAGLSAIALSSAAAASITTAWLRSFPIPLPHQAPDRPRLAPGPQRRVGVVVNPVKNRAEEAQEAVADALRRQGWEAARFYETTPEDAGTGPARQALADGCDLILALGGDGTVRAVAAEVAGTDAVLGIVPLGTGNLLARNTDLPFTDLHGCLDIALNGPPREIDLIKITAEIVDDDHRCDTPRTLTERFTVMGGAGFDAQIMTDTRDELKATMGWVAYAEAGLRNLVARRHSVKITLDGRTPVRRKTRAVIVANTGDLTAGLRLAADSTVDDGRLEVILLTPRTLIDWAALSWQVLTRRKSILPVIEHLHGTKVHVDFLHHSQPMELDGDYLGHVRTFTAEVQPGVLRMSSATS